jgi:hypothetical protein
MSELFNQTVQPCSTWKHCFWMITAILSVPLGILQTDWFVTRLNHPTDVEVRQMLKEDDEEQQKIRLQYERETRKAPTKGIVFHERFEPNPTRMLTEALAKLKANRELQQAIKNDFGKTFDDLNAVVFPAWETAHHKSVFGLTDFGIAAARDASGQLFAAGFTVRDRHKMPRITDEGVPRVGIDVEAFEDQETLKVSLFHELLHAMNVPKYEPAWYTFALLQHDLAYCDQYRAYVKRFGFKNNRESLVRIGIMLPLLTFGYLLLRLALCVWKRRRQPAVPLMVD